MVESEEVSFGSAIEFVEEDLPRADLAQLDKNQENNTVVDFCLVKTRSRSILDPH